MDIAHAEALAARSHLAREGWIPRRSESFRHLPPPEAALWLGEEPAAVGELAAPVDGWTFSPVLAPAAGDVEVRRLDAADPAQRIELFAGLPPPGDDEAAPFAWAHRALVRRGLRLRIAPGAQPARLVLRHRATSAAEAPLLVIELLPGARCVLLEAHEQGSGPALAQNLQVHVRLGEGANLQHLRVATPAAGDRIAHHLHVRLEAHASYAQCLLATGSDYHLQRNVLDLQGAGASARTGAVLLAHGSALEQQVLARHAAPNTGSTVEMLALAAGVARVVGNAHTHIAAGCDAAQTRQKLAGVPTGGQPRIVLRPHLEILHDQVQAAHGATWGALPEEALFHARQRGLDERAAKALILQGLAQSALTRAIDDTPLHEALRLEAQLAAAVARHLGASEVHHG
jgi:Fe-S cluster assembly protein SufD